jgi:hypothetical protein
MSFLHNGEYRMAGHIRFDDETSEDLLKVLLNGIKTLAPEETWVDLHIRSAGDDGTHYIHLCRRLKDGERDTQRRAVHKILQFLKGKLGEKPLGGIKQVCGWSISTVIAIA